MHPKSIAKQRHATCKSIRQKGESDRKFQSASAQSSHRVGDHYEDILEMPEAQSLLIPATPAARRTA